MRAGLPFLVVAGLCWGTAGTLGTLLARATGLPFLAVAGYRITIGGALLLLFVLLARRARWPGSRQAWARVAVLGACSLGYQLSYFSAVGQVGVSIATLVAIGSSPVIAAIVDVATGRHRMDGRLVATLLVALAGVGFLAGVPEPGLDGGRLALGALLALGAGAAFALISVIGARPVEGFDDASGTGLALLAGGLATLGIAALAGPIGFALDARSALLAIALGLVPSAIAYLSYLRGLRSQSSTTGTLVTLLEPVTGVILATLILGERLGWAGVLGAAALLAAVVLAAVPRPELTVE